MSRFRTERNIVFVFQFVYNGSTYIG